MKQPLRILLVEDSPYDVSLIEWKLKKDGVSYTSKVSRNREEFEYELREFRPDVILCDHSLPEFNSIEAFQVYKAFQKEVGELIPFILVTGNVSEEFAVQALKAGVNDYILKDRLQRLTAAIRNALEKCRIENERLKYFGQVVAKEALMSEAESMAHFGSWEADLVAGTHSWSDATYAIYGMKPGDIESSYDRFLSYVHPEDLPGLLEIHDHAMKFENERMMEFRIIDIHGNVKYISCKLKIERNAEGVPTRVVGFNLDITAQKNSESALRKSEQEYRSLFEQNPDPVFSLDLEGRFTNVNNGFREMVGYSRSELIGQDFRDILVNSRLAQVYNAFLFNHEQKSQRYETQFVNREGKEHTLDVTIMRIVVEDKVIGIHCVGKDITEKRQLEKLLDQAYRTARIGGWEVDLTSKKISWTTITREIYEVPEDYQLDMESNIRFYEDDRSRERVWAAFQTCIESDRPWDLELKITTGKGNERWVRVIGQGERKDGACIRLYGTIQDVDERRKAEEAKRTAYEEKVNILESIGDAFFAVDQNWTVTYWNNMAETLLLMPRHKILGKNLWQEFTGQLSLSMYKDYKEAMAKGQPLHYEKFYPELDFWAEVNVYPSPTGLSIFFRDVTEQKNRTFEVEQQNNKLREIARIQSHEVRAPLARIIGLVSLINDGITDETELSFVLQHLDTSARELDGVIRKIVNKTERLEPAEIV